MSGEISLHKVQKGRETCQTLQKCRTLCVRIYAGMALLRVPTNFNIDLEFESPEFHRRIIALCVDFLLQFFYYLLAWNIYIDYVWNHPTLRAMENFTFMWIIIITPGYLYPLICEMTLNGQTLGKKLLGIQVVNENGGRPSFSQILIRFLLNPMSFIFISIVFYQPFLLWSILSLVVDVVIAVTNKNFQRTGDLLAHTILIKPNASGSVHDTVFMEVAENYRPSFPQIMQLSDRDINAVKQILDTAVKNGDFQLAAMATEKIKNHLKIESSLSPFEFLEIVMKDYNYLSTK